MFKSKTVFIVGAGASKEGGLPTGVELKKTIADKLNFTYPRGGINGDWIGGDTTIEASLKSYMTQIRRTGYFEPILRACRKIRDAMPQASSIDTFIDHHHDDEFITLCGKVAILESIFESRASQ